MAFCTDTNESFGCICDDGYDGDGVTCTIVCTAGTEPNEEGNQCIDIDECASNPCGANFNCINGNNQFTCECDAPKFDQSRFTLEYFVLIFLKLAMTVRIKTNTYQLVVQPKVAVKIL